MMVESPITSTPDLVRLRKSLGGSSSNSSLKRRKLQASAERINPKEFKNYRLPTFLRCNYEVARYKQVRNNDDAERSSLVASERAVATSTPHSPRRARDTMCLSPEKMRCLKLYAENKINKVNAWDLQLIDFMTSMLRKHDERMDNLQTASMLVEASARIYSYRVDSLHYDVLKMAEGLSKAAKVRDWTKRGKRDHVGCTQDEGAADGDAGRSTRTRKKRTRGAVAPNPEVFCGDFETNVGIDPFFEKLAATAGDICSANRAFNATLPVDDITYGLILGTDDLFLEPINENIPEDLDLSERIVLPANLFPAFTSEDQICEPFTGFSISNWDPETEDTNARVNKWLEENRLNLSQQALAFDVNAEVEPVPPEEAHNDLFDAEPLRGLESEWEQDVAVQACAARAAPEPLPWLTDMRPGTPADARLEYSYSGAIVNAWAGPRHWRFKNNRAYERSQTTAGRVTLEGSKKPTRTKRQLHFLGAGLAFDHRAATSGDYEPAPPAKIMISKKTLTTGRAWNEANFKMPIDMGLDVSHFRERFLYRNIPLKRPPPALAAAPEPQPPPEPEPLDEARHYDYNNENNASYCPNNVPDGDDWRNVPGTSAGGDWRNVPGTSAGGDWRNVPGTSAGGDWRNVPGTSAGDDWRNVPGTSAGGDWRNVPGTSAGDDWRNVPGTSAGGDWRNVPGTSAGDDWRNVPGTSAGDDWRNVPGTSAGDDWRNVPGTSAGDDWRNVPGTSAGDDWRNVPGTSAGDDWRNVPGTSAGDDWRNVPGTSAGGDWRNVPGTSAGDDWRNVPGTSAGDDWRNVPGTSAGGLHEQAKAAEPDEIGDLLEPPAKVAKIFIPYALRAKKIDMKQLMRCTWKILTEKSQGEKEEVTPTTFSTIYNKLPTMLSSNVRDSLSVPLTFLSVLHLANEKGLKLEQHKDLKDFSIAGLKE